MNRIINKDILPRISKISKNQLENDLLSIAYIVLLIFIILASGVVILNNLRPIFIQLSVIFLNFYNSIEAFILKKDSFLHYNFPNDFGGIFGGAINLFVKIFFITFIPLILRKIFNKENFFCEIIVVLGATIAIIITFNLYLGIGIVAGIIFLFLAFVPIGKNRFYKFVQNLNYFEEVIFNYYEENPFDINEQQVLYKTVLIIFFVFIIDFTMVRMLNFNIKFSTILACSAILLVWLYQNKSVTESYLLKKLIIYIIFFLQH